MTRQTSDRLKCNAPLGRMPVLQFCPPGELQIDPDYQRGLEDSRSMVLVRRIAQHWNWDLCQPLVVARRPGAQAALFVIDGQHRLAAARLRGDIAQLPCVVQDFAHVADEAASFVHLNQQRKPLNRLDLFRAAVASGDTRALAISSAIKAAGLALANHTNIASWKPGVVMHIGGIERAWNRDGELAARAALIALGRGFVGQVQRYAGTLYRGLVAVARDEIRVHGSFAGERMDRFVALLQTRDQPGWTAQMRKYIADDPLLFQGEACEAMFRAAWEVCNGTGLARQNTPPPTPRGGEPVSTPKPQGFGLGAGDYKGDAEWIWCMQCDLRRTRDQAAGCVSRFCRIKHHGSAGE